MDKYTPSGLDIYAVDSVSRRNLVACVRIQDIEKKSPGFTVEDLMRTMRTERDDVWEAPLDYRDESGAYRRVEEGTPGYVPMGELLLFSYKEDVNTLIHDEYVETFLQDAVSQYNVMTPEYQKYLDSLREEFPNIVFPDQQDEKEMTRYLRRADEFESDSSEEVGTGVDSSVTPSEPRAVSPDNVEALGTNDEILADRTHVDGVEGVEPVEDYSGKHSIEDPEIIKENDGEISDK